MSSDLYYTVEDGEVPPSYIDAVSPPSYAGTSPFQRVTSNQSSSISNETVLPPAVTTSVTGTLATHLHNLPARMRANQEARVSQQASQDLEIITFLAPHVEKFLADLGCLDRIPPRAELTLVPGSVVPRGAKMSDAVERRREGEVVRVVRVEVPRPKKDDSDLGKKGDGGYPSEKGQPNRTASGNGFEDSDEDERRSESGFDEWGRFDTSTESGPKENPLFFRDEAMALRLANYLRPEPNLDRRHIQAVVAGVPSPGGTQTGKASGSGWKWGWKKQQQPAVPKSPSTGSPMLSPGQTEQASMTVRVEEVAFRVVNEFGIYEILTGFGIVVTVKIRL